MQILEGHKGHVFSLAFSPDGRTLASGDAYNVVRLWDVETSEGRVLFKVNRPKRRQPGVHGLAFHPGGGAIAAAGGGPEPTVFDLATGKPGRGLTGHEEPVYLVAYTGEGTLVSSSRATYGMTEAIAWAGDRPEHRSRLVFQYHSIRSLAVDRDTDSVALGTRDGGYLWLPLLTPRGQTHYVALPNRLAGSGDLDPPDGDKKQCLLSLPLPVNQDVAAVALSPGGRFVATAHWTSVRLIDTQEFHVLAVLEGHAEPAEALAFSPDGRTLASGSQDGTLRLWDVESRSERACLDAEDGWVNAVAFSPDGMTVAAACEEDIFLWDVGGDAW